MTESNLRRLALAGPVLYLARHGETDYNRRKIFQGRTDIPLNDRGREQAVALRELLRPIALTRAYFSPLERARVTGSIILEDRPIPQTVEPRLIEIFFGDWEGTPEAEVRDRWIGDYMDYRNDMSRFHPENGERAVDAQSRAGEWWDEVCGRFASPDEHILVVAHQSLNAVLACYVSGIPLSQAWENFKTGPGEVIRIVPSAIPQISRLLPVMD